MEEIAWTRAGVAGPPVAIQTTWATQECLMEEGIEETVAGMMIVQGMYTVWHS